MRTTASASSLLAALLAAAAPRNGAALTEAERKAVLDIHNKLRGQEGASDMPGLVYDLELEKTAQKWVDLCTFTHSQQDYQNYPECGTMQENKCGQAYGENFGMSTATDYELVFATNDWYSEKPDWTYTDGKYQNSYCDTTGGKMCGHYTQVVSKQSRKIGCALKTDCTGHSSWKSLGLCQYDPPGNMNTYFLYSKGTACSECELGYDCCEQGVCFGATPAAPTGDIEWQFFGCQMAGGVPGSGGTFAAGTCNLNAGDSKYYQLDVALDYSGAATPTGRAWGVKYKKCDDAACSTGCTTSSVQAFDACPTGQGHKFIWNGAAMPAAPATLSSGAAGSCAASSGGSGGSSNSTDGGNSGTPSSGGSGGSSNSTDGGNSGTPSSGGSGGSSNSTDGGNSGTPSGNGTVSGASTTAKVAVASFASAAGARLSLGLLLALLAAP
eukprot:TRINITY_DN1336_c0_g1_i1.p1 TRINITY_DN1336_c0_g1~~TRINITY_DN1336_c0_g1_i1.p1  ORF type:complete len:440 (+),score=128.65 TRINITY_DN1336_c0_g1_i1:94-1413(+)